ncbi:MAG: magnesium/cobalt transporter CorA [Planctomycetota bacterium]|jgi:magnesium transporter
MIRVHRLEKGELTTLEGPDAVAVPKGEGRVWICAVAPDAQEAEVLAKALGIHDLAMQTALRTGQRPQVGDYGDHLFVVASAPGTDGEQLVRKVAVFLGESWILTVERGSIAAMEDVEERVLHEPARFLVAPERVLHALLDQIVEAFGHRIDRLSDQTEALEARILTAYERSDFDEIFALRREMARLSRVMRAQRDMYQTLGRTNHAVLSQRITPYLRDAYDHCLRACERLDSVREGIAAARDAYLTQVNNRLSETMRVLTVIATIMMPLGVVAGVFGMNFEPMPMLRTPWGFWVSMAAMAVISGGMLLWFRRRGWL